MTVPPLLPREKDRKTGGGREEGERERSGYEISRGRRGVTLMTVPPLLPREKKRKTAGGERERERER